MSAGPEPHPDALTELVRILREQLNRKDERIATLEARLEEANQRVNEQQHLVARVIERNIAALTPAGVAPIFTPPLDTPAVRRVVPTRARTLQPREEPLQHPEPAQDVPAQPERPLEPGDALESNGIDHTTALVFDSPPSPSRVESDDQGFAHERVQSRESWGESEGEDPAQHSAPHSLGPADAGGETPPLHGPGTQHVSLMPHTSLLTPDEALTHESESSSEPPAAEGEDAAEITARMDRRALRRGHRALAAASTGGRRRFWPWRSRTGTS